LSIFRYGKKKYETFGIAFRDQNTPVWRFTTPNKLPDDRTIVVHMPLNLTPRMLIFSIWFSTNSEPPKMLDLSTVMAAPVMVDLNGENGIEYTAAFKPDCVEID
jgi:hypothetical protein